ARTTHLGNPRPIQPAARGRGRAPPTRPCRPITRRKGDLARRSVPCVSHVDALPPARPVERPAGGVPPRPAPRPPGPPRRVLPPRTSLTCCFDRPQIFFEIFRRSRKPFRGPVRLTARIASPQRGAGPYPLRPAPS